MRKRKKTSASTKKKKAKYNKKRRIAIKKKLYDFILKNPCVDCGEDDPVVLQFDHIKGYKTNNISHMVQQGYSWNNILLEIFKCEVRCANCHQRKTSKAQKWYASLNISNT